MQLVNLCCSLHLQMHAVHEAQQFWLIMWQALASGPGLYATIFGSLMHKYLESLQAYA